MSTTKKNKKPKYTADLPAIVVFLLSPFLTFFDYGKFSSCCKFFPRKELDKYYATESNIKKDLKPYLFVSTDNTLNKAYEICRRVYERLKIVLTIVVDEGTHRVVTDERGYLNIVSPVNIIGSLDKDIAKIQVVFCGFKIKEDLKEKVHLQHLLIQNSRNAGVFGSSSFSLNDVIISCSDCYGLVASGSSTRVTCTNVIVRCCKYSGVRIQMGASVVFNGEKSKIFYNCIQGGGFGVQLVHSSSKIKIVSPLTKKNFSTYNALFKVNNPSFKQLDWDWGAVDGATLDQIEIE